MSQPVRWTILVILLFCCIDLIKSKARIPSVYDCQKKDKVLNCTNHGFQNVPLDFFKHYGIFKIHLSGNPYICDCSMVWFLREPPLQKETIKDLHEMRCSYPNKVYRKKITELKEEEICDTKRVSYKTLPCVPPTGKRGSWNCDLRKLDYIPYDIFERKQRFSLVGEYICDCNMVWFIRRLKYLWNRILLPNLRGVKCKAPKKFSSAPVYTLTENDVCPQKEPDPCLVRPSPCPKDSKCQVTGKTSYRCVEIDDCRAENRCPKNSRCVLVSGSSRCVCKSGFSKRDRKCRDINECKTEQHDCDKNARCINTKPGYKCQCKPGFKQYDNGRKCKEIDQCKAKNRCPKNSRCIVASGSYRCVCKTGFSTEGENCKDIDECRDSRYCSPRSVCENTPGSYLCKCKKGFVGNETSCTDINECATQEHDCDENAECINTKPGYKCQCKPGFKRYNNGRKCKEIDQCKDKNPCPNNSRCIVVSGSYRCVCKTGFSKMSEKCIDIDECRDSRYCSPHSVCENTPGSYLCKCKKGFVGNGTSCTDIDECTDTSFCGSTSVCENTPGSYLCKCKKGFVGNGRSCADINECLKRSTCPAKSKKCINTLGSYFCKCRAGYEWRKKHCIDVNECKTRGNACHQNAICINHDGSYECRCKEGFQLKDKTLCVKYSQLNDDNADESTQEKKSTLVVAIVVPISLGFVISLAVGSVWFARRMKPKKKKKKEITYF